MKLRVPEVFLGALLAALIFSLGFVAASLGRGATAPASDLPAVWASVIVNSFVALASLALWVTTANAMRRQADEAIVTNRAYLSVEPRGINPLRGRANVIGHIAIRNVGRIPAREVAARVYMARSGRDFEPRAIKASEAEGRRVVQPSAEIFQGSEENIERTIVKQGGDEDGHFIYVWGVVYYRDDLVTARYTSFCHRYNIASRYDDPDAHGSIIGAEKARYHENGNDAV